MAAIDNLHAAVARGRVTGAVLAANGITGADADLFRRQVEGRRVNPTIPAAVATALGVTQDDARRNLTRRHSLVGR